MKESIITKRITEKELMRGENLLSYAELGYKKTGNIIMLLSSLVFFSFCATMFFNEGGIPAKESLFSALLMGGIGLGLFFLGAIRLFKARFNYCFVTNQRFCLRGGYFNLVFAKRDIKRENIRDAHFVAEPYYVGLAVTKTDYLVNVSLHSGENISVIIRRNASEIADAVQSLVI